MEVRLGESVKEIAADKVVLESGEIIPCGLVIWAAGVATEEFADVLDLPRARGGRIEVGEDLRVSSRPEVFVVGDAAGTLTRDGLLPQLAQPAIQTGKHAGRQIKSPDRGRETTPFRYKDKGIMATIGRRSAVAELPARIRLRGTLAWIAWLGLHIAHPDRIPQSPVGSLELGLAVRSVAAWPQRDRRRLNGRRGRAGHPHSAARLQSRPASTIRRRNC